MFLSSWKRFKSLFTYSIISIPNSLDDFNDSCILSLWSKWFVHALEWTSSIFQNFFTSFSKIWSPLVNVSTDVSTFAQPNFKICVLTCSFLKDETPTLPLNTHPNIVSKSNRTCSSLLNISREKTPIEVPRYQNVNDQVDVIVIKLARSKSPPGKRTSWQHRDNHLLVSMEHRQFVSVVRLHNNIKGYLRYKTIFCH